MKGKTILCISILYIVAIILMSVLITPFIGSFNDHEYILTVTDKDRVNTSKNSCYLVFCEDESGNTVVLKNSDMRPCRTYHG